MLSGKTICSGRKAQRIQKYISIIDIWITVTTNNIYKFSLLSQA